MSKEAVISEILALPDAAQREIFALLRTRFAQGEQELSAAQMRELDRRLDVLDRSGSTGEKWEVVEQRLLKARADARHHH
jgi:hypothetical protein